MLFGVLMLVAGIAFANPDTGLDEPGEPATDRAYPHRVTDTSGGAIPDSLGIYQDWGG
jgi:hypothetical protein